MFDRERGPGGPGSEHFNAMQEAVEEALAEDAAGIETPTQEAAAPSAEAQPASHAEDVAEVIAEALAEDEANA